jgi:hypothetical protein
MDWITSLWVSVLGAAVWSAALVGFRWAYHRSGKLSGTWYQVTYHSDDAGMTGIPWSVELVRARHHRAESTGTMWRIHRPFPDRKWSFWARYDDGRLDGTYWSVRGDGGTGSIHLRQFSNSNLRGRFVESQLRDDSIVYLVAPLEWIRVGSPDEIRVLPWLDLSESNRMSRHLPHRVTRLLRRQLSNCLDEHGEDANNWRRRLLESCSYTGALSDLTGPLAMEAEKQRRGFKASPGTPVVNADRTGPEPAGASEQQV